MANICSNTLQVISDNPKNHEYVKEFFNKEWGSCDVEEIMDGTTEYYFDSKWTFPDLEMNKLYKGIPDKDDIDMACLSVEWGCRYCAFHECDFDGWTEC
jgi:hypothetical protein